MLPEVELLCFNEFLHGAEFLFSSLSQFQIDLDTWMAAMGHLDSFQAQCCPKFFLLQQVQEVKAVWVSAMRRSCESIKTCPLTHSAM